MVQSKITIRNRINQFINKLQKYVTVDKVILYGSWVNGNPGEFSDIDLAVFSPEFGKNKLKELQLLSKLAWEVDESIEAIPYSSNQLNNHDPTNFVYEIMKTGETIYDRAIKH
ncbi:nucleotidyltransferase domain-containing protein [Halothermothrix orenii]|uniref:nucleotidyltransferase domain-containing protein n=1 Tax=Halothermothrix orenii TaxID=31909 RepID=UPI0002E17EAD|nr:nucleotidyltransferase domain-containing protein [Halothermothrix orenii]